MISHVLRKKNKPAMSLDFDCLTPEEAHKILDVLFDEGMDEVLSDNIVDVELDYGVTGYRLIDEKRSYSHDLVIFIETPEAAELPILSVEDQLKSDQEFLEKLREVILEKTGIKEEES